MSHKSAKRSRHVATRMMKVNTVAMAEIVTHANEREQMLISEIDDFYTYQFQQVAKTAAQQSPTPRESMAAGLHDTADICIARAKSQLTSRVITCAKGCNHCCFIQVTILPQEAALLALAIRQGDVVVDLERARKQAQVMADAPPLVLSHNYDPGRQLGAVRQWEALPYEDRACMFLTPEGACGAYDYRPTPCRNHMSTDEPAKCDTRVHRSDIEFFVSVESEVMFNAAINQWGKGVNMPTAVLAELESEDG